MLKYASYLVIFLSSQLGFSQEIHCGYDFTSYIVIEPREDGKDKVIDGLKITLTDFLGLDLVNTNNQYSWTKTNEVLQFYKNYKIDDKGEKVALDNPKAKWYFYFAKDAYLVSVNNEFQAEHFKIKIEDPSGVYRTTFIPLHSFNMYVLCTAEARAAQFGRRGNQPIKVVVEKNK